MNKLIKGTTKVHLIVEENDINKLRTLSKNELFVFDDDGESPLHYAATNGNQIICDWLVYKCPELRNIRDNEGKTAVDWARKYNDIKF